MLKIINCLDPWEPIQKSSNFFGLPFEIEKNCWEWVEDRAQADLIVCSDIKESAHRAKRISQKTIPILFLDVWHDDDYRGTHEYFKEVLKSYDLENENVIWVHTRIENTDSRHIPYNFLFNRSKMYYFNYKEIQDPPGKIWTYGVLEEFFKLNCITKSPNAKKFLSPNRINGGPESIRMTFRQQLLNFLKSYDGFYPDNENRVYLEPEGGITSATKNWLTQSGAWYPIANNYYEESFVNIYVETLTSSNKKAFHATEKTLDPLVKGQFILPFSTPGFIENCKKHFDFKFPTWINYSYDDIEDTFNRFEQFMKSVEELVKMDNSKLFELYEQDKWILEHNRKRFIDIPYDNLYNKVRNFLGEKHAR